MGHGDGVKGHAAVNRFVEVAAHYVDGVLGGTSATTNLPDDENLALSFGCQNGEGANNYLDVDYVYIAQER